MRVSMESWLAFVASRLRWSGLAITLEGDFFAIVTTQEVWLKPSVVRKNFSHTTRCDPWSSKTVYVLSKLATDKLSVY